MRIFTLLLTLFIVSYTFANKNISDDSIIYDIVYTYQNAIKTKDIELSKKCFITEFEFKELVQYVKNVQPNCIGTDEENFSTNLNDKSFRSIINSDIKINQVFINKIEYNNSCGDLLVIPRVICTIQYTDNKTVEVPFLFIKTINGEYKILRNFLSNKLFTL